MFYFEVIYETFNHGTQNHWVSGLRPSSGIQNTRKLNVSESIFVSSLTCPMVEVSSL
jgi:hypothetical protein